MGKFSTIYHVFSSMLLIGLLTVSTEISVAKNSSPASVAKKVEEKKSEAKKVVANLFHHLAHHRKHHHPRRPAYVVPVPTPPPGACSVPFSEKVHAAQIKRHHVYVNLSDLNFLKSEYGFWLQDVELEVTYKDKKKQQNTLTLALNGIKASQPGSFKGSGLESLLKPNGQSCSRFKLHQLLANGSEPFHHLLLRLKKNKGQLKISVLGRHSQIIDAYVTFKGQSFVSCSPSTTTTTTTTTSTTTTTTQPPVVTTSTTLPPVTTTSTTTTSTTTTTTTTTLPPEDLSKYQVRIDSISPSGSPTSSTNMLISFSSEFSDGTYWCALDQAPFDKCQSSVSFAGLSNGDHTFQVYAQTPRGVIASEPVAYSWNVDSVAPTVRITNLADLPNLTNQVSITFQFVSSKPGTFKCSLNGAASNACTSPITYVVSEGLHNFSVTAIDTVGNVSGSPAQFQWSVDLTPPVTSFAAVEPNEDLSRNPSRSLAFASSETSNFECSIDQGGYSACESPVVLSGLSEGSHSFEVRAVDLAGNVGSSVSASWTQDYTAPEISIGNVNPSVGLTNAGNASVEFFLNEPGQAYCLWDSQDPVACSSPFTAAFDGDGNHQLAIYAVDSVGNRSAKTFVSWTVDMTAPLISFGAILPSGETYQKSTDLNAQLILSEALTWSASLNGAPISAGNPIELLGLSDGAYILSVSGFDAAGNLSNTIEHSFVIDTQAPQIGLSADGVSLINRDSRVFTLESNETVTFECALDEAGFEPCQSPKSYSGLADGDHNLIVRATDLAGNQSQTSDSWSVDTIAPSTSESHNQSGSAITFSLSSNESGVSFICSLDGASFSNCSSPVSYSGLVAGPHSFAAKAIDAAGNVDPVGASYSFNTDMTPPTVTSVTTSSTTNSITVTWFLNEAGTGKVTYGVGSALNQSTIETSTTATTYSIKLTGLSSNTMYSIQVSGRDAAGNVYTSNIITARTNR